jgi:Ankyrin repeats (3 copies)
MNVHYKSCLFVLLSIVSSVCFGMEQTVVVIPKQARIIFDDLKNNNEYYYCRDNAVAGKFGKEKAWYGLMCAVWYENIPVVQMLLNDGALDRDAVAFECGKRGPGNDIFRRINTLPLTLAKHKNNQEIIAQFERIKHPAPLANNMCPLYALATYLGDLNLLNQCITDNDFDPNYDNERGGSLIAMAVRGGHDDVVERLLQIDQIKKNINDTSYNAPVVYIAAQNGYCSIMQQLLKVPDINVPAYYFGNNYHGPALCIAAQYGHTGIVELLCEHKDTDVNDVDSSKNTALHYAVQGGNIKMTSILLVKKADINKKNNSGETVWDILDDWNAENVKVMRALLNAWKPVSK